MQLTEEQRLKKEGDSYADKRVAFKKGQIPEGMVQLILRTFEDPSMATEERMKYLLAPENQQEKAWDLVYDKVSGWEYYNPHGKAGSYKMQWYTTEWQDEQDIFLTLAPDGSVVTVQLLDYLRRREKRRSHAQPNNSSAEGGEIITDTHEQVENEDKLKEEHVPLVLHEGTQAYSNYVEASKRLQDSEYEKSLPPGWNTHGQRVGNYQRGTILQSVDKQARAEIRWNEVKTYLSPVFEEVWDYNPHDDTLGKFFAEKLQVPYHSVRDARKEAVKGKVLLLAYNVLTREADLSRFYLMLQRLGEGSAVIIRDHRYKTTKDDSLFVDFHYIAYSAYGDFRPIYPRTAEQIICSRWSWTITDITQRHIMRNYLAIGFRYDDYPPIRPFASPPEPTKLVRRVKADEPPRPSISWIVTSALTGPSAVGKMPFSRQRGEIIWATNEYMKIKEGDEFRLRGGIDTRVVAGVSNYYSLQDAVLDHFFDIFSSRSRDERTKKSKAIHAMAGQHRKCFYVAFKDERG